MLVIFRDPSGKQIAGPVVVDKQDAIFAMATSLKGRGKVRLDSREHKILRFQRGERLGHPTDAGFSVEISVASREWLQPIQLADWEQLQVVWPLKRAEEDVSQPAPTMTAFRGATLQVVDDANGRDIGTFEVNLEAWPGIGNVVRQSRCGAKIILGGQPMRIVRVAQCARGASDVRSSTQVFVRRRSKVEPFALESFDQAPVVFEQ